jgi:hypothetical protein
LCKKANAVIRINVPKPEVSIGYSEKTIRKLDSLAEQMERYHGQTDDNPGLHALKQQWIALDKKAMEGRAAYFANELQALFNKKNPMPVGVAYDPRILEGPIKGDSMPAHASVIIGRRLNNGHCEYLVRNSYGPKCSQSYVYPCEDGSIWVPVQDLTQYTDQLVWISSK